MLHRVYASRCIGSDTPWSLPCRGMASTAAFLVPVLAAPLILPAPATPLTLDYCAVTTTLLLRLLSRHRVRASPPCFRLFLTVSVKRHRSQLLSSKEKVLRPILLRPVSYANELPCLRCLCIECAFLFLVCEGKNL